MKAVNEYGVFLFRLEVLFWNVTDSPASPLNWIWFDSPYGLRSVKLRVSSSWNKTKRCPAAASGHSGRGTRPRNTLLWSQPLAPQNICIMAIMSLTSSVLLLQFNIASLCRHRKYPSKLIICISVWICVFMCLFMCVFICVLHVCFYFFIKPALLKMNKMFSCWDVFCHLKEWLKTRYTPAAVEGKSLQILTQARISNRHTFTVSHAAD